MQIPSTVGFFFQFNAKWGLLRKDNRISLDGTFIFDGKRHLCFLERHCHFQETPFILLLAWFTRCWDQSKDQIRSSEHATIILTVQQLEQCSACRVPPRFSSPFLVVVALYLSEISITVVSFSALQWILGSIYDLTVQDCVDSGWA